MNEIRQAQAPLKFEPTRGVVEMTQPPAVRDILISEFDFMQQEQDALAEATDRSTSAGSVIGATVGTGLGTLVTLIMHGDNSLPILGLTGGAAVGFVSDLRVNSTVAGIRADVDEIAVQRNRHFAETVWSALPDDVRTVVEKTLSPVIEVSE